MQHCSTCMIKSFMWFTVHHRIKTAGSGADPSASDITAYLEDACSYILWYIGLYGNLPAIIISVVQLLWTSCPRSSILVLMFDTTNTVL